MDVVYFLVFLLVLVIAFVVTYFFRDTIKRIFGGGEEIFNAQGKIWKYYDLKNNPAKLPAKINTAKVNAAQLKTDNGGRIDKLDETIDEYLKYITDLEKTILDSETFVLDSVKQMFRHLGVDGDNFKKAIDNKNLNDFKNVFTAAGITAAQVDNNHIIKPDIFAAGDIKWDSYNSTMKALEKILIKKDKKKTKQALESAANVEQIYKTVEAAVAEIDRMADDFINIKNYYPLNIMKNSLMNIWKEFSDKYEEAIKLDPKTYTSYSRLVVEELLNRLPKHKDINDITKDPYKPGYDAHHEYEGIEKDINPDTKANFIDNAARIGILKRASDNSKKFDKQIKKLRQIIDDTLPVVKLLIELEPFLVHEDALAVLDKIDTHLLNLVYSNVHSDLEKLEKLKSEAKSIAVNIPVHQAEIIKHIKAFDLTKLRAEIESYSKDLKTLQNLKSQAGSLKEKAETKAAQERSLDSSSGDYVFDSHEIISDTKLEEMISQGKEDKIGATLSRNIDIPKQEIEKIIKKRKEKLRERTN